MPCSGYLALHGVNPNQKKKKIDIKRTPSKVDIENSGLVFGLSLLLTMKTLSG